MKILQWMNNNMKVSLQEKNTLYGNLLHLSKKFPALKAKLQNLIKIFPSRVFPKDITKIIELK